MTERAKRILVTGLYFVGGALCLRAFFDVSRFYSGFEAVLGFGILEIPSEELVYSLWFVFLGLLAAINWSLGIARTSLPCKLQAVFDRLTQQRGTVVGLTLAVFLLAVFFRAFVLLDAPVTDDESTYVFIAQTLRHGRLVNPLPPDSGLFANQFVVMNQQGWFGKYPIGHPLVIMVADLLRARFFVGPILTGLSLLFTYLVGKRAFGAKTAVLGVLLLATSPHFLLTGATLLSQTTSTLVTMAGLYLVLRFIESPRTWFAALAGLLFAFGIVVRPLPGALLFGGVLAIIAFQTNQVPIREHLRSRLPGLLSFVLFGGVALAMLLLVNLVQTGSALQTGYHAAHASNLGVLSTREGQRLMSVAAALLRQNLWLFGWPISLIFVCFMRRNRTLPLFVALVAAEYLYRVLAPKTVVSSTGPIYVTEIVPLLALASASGIAEIKKRLEGWGFSHAGSALVAVAMSFTLVAWFCFWPTQLAGLGEGARQWRFPYDQLKDQGIAKALIFTDRMVRPDSGKTWAYYPPNPSPTLDDDILFVRPPEASPDLLTAMQEFRQRRYPDRPAFFLQLTDKKPTLVQLPPVP